jgi:hypothetical protein
MRYAKGKYEKAVGEAYKMIFNSRHTPKVLKMTRRNMIQRIARIHLEKNKWEEVSNQELEGLQETEVWTLYNIAYGSIGKHIGSKEELKRKYPLFEVIDHDDKPDIDIFIGMKKTPFGKKISAMGHDGTRKSKKAVMLKMTSLLKTRGYFTEASDAVEALLKRSGFENIKDDDVIMKIVGHKGDIILEGDGYYSRSLGSIGRHTKSLYGNPIV